VLRKLELADMDAAALVRGTAFAQAMPWLPTLHTAEEDQSFFRERLFKSCELWGAFAQAELVGLIAFREDWIDQLSVLPNAQRRGVGSALLQVAQRAFLRLDLWTFQRNAPARRFYEARGFVLIPQTDGAQNEEQEPDTLYRWTRNQPERR
jgi:GNAT superfamily N-acetyltransferase